MGLKSALDGLARRNAADDKRGVQAAIALGDDDAAKGLLAPVFALDNERLDGDCVTGREIGDGLGQTRDFLFLETNDSGVGSHWASIIAKNAAFLSGFDSPDNALIHP